MRVDSPAVCSTQTGCPVSQRDRLATIEQRIVAEEGPSHVGGQYYANASDAERQRRAAAEREVRETERRAQWLARQLAGVTVANGQELVRLALGVTARAIQLPEGERLTPEQVAQVVAAARVLWHAMHDHAEDAPQVEVQQHTANGRAA